MDGGALKSWGLVVEGLLAKGRSSRVYRARHTQSGRLLAIKVEHEKSRRNHAVEKEAMHLAAANQLGIGPKLYGFDPVLRIVVMEFIPGVSLEKFVFDTTVSKSQLLPVIKSLVKQAKKMDAASLDHGQLAGRGTNIIVKSEKGKYVPVIIDFEKASQTRKCHNWSQLVSLFLHNPRARLGQVLREKIGREIVSQTLK